jgi:hypothetical protein
MKAAFLLISALAFASAQDGCKAPAVINAEHGVIRTPYYGYYPEFSYPANLRCRYSINVPSGNNISFTFTPPFRTEGSYPTSCSFDYVMFYTGNLTGPVTCPRSPLLGSRFSVVAGPFCGQINENLTFVVGDSSVVMEFCTDPSVQSEGFQLTFNATDEAATAVSTASPITTTPIPSVSCGGNINSSYFMTNPTLYIESPNYPNNYPNDVVCVWNINGTEGQGLKVNAEDFETEASPGCAYDWLNIQDLTESVDLGKFCSTNGPVQLRTNGNRLLILFRSDSSGAFRGFRLRIEVARCNNSFSACPNEPNGDECRFHPSMLCDGKEDCPGGADENCPSECGVSATKPFLSTKQKIVGGIEARPHSWPWQVALVVGKEEALACGGSVIDHHYVLTAAHCCDGQTTSLLRIRVGEHNLRGSREPNAITYELKNIFMHPRYNRQPVLSNDFCLLETKLPIFFNEHVTPICLPTQSDAPPGKTCYITGWGEVNQNIVDLEGNNRMNKNEKLSENKDISPVLRQVDVAIVSQEECNNDLFGLITQDMICDEKFGKDSCQGDSGGPLQCSSFDDPNRFELVGVVSWAIGCADPKFPGINGRVSAAIDWIADIIMNRSKQH